MLAESPDDKLHSLGHLNTESNGKSNNLMGEYFGKVSIGEDCNIGYVCISAVGVGGRQYISLGRGATLERRVAR